MVCNRSFYCLFSQNAMNLPPDKARLLRQYDNEKKWELICDQVRESKGRELLRCSCVSSLFEEVHGFLHSDSLTSGFLICKGKGTKS